VNDASLYQSFGEYGMDCIGKPARAIHGSDEHGLNVSILEVRDHRQPEIGPLSTFTDPMA
jgi:hypothetical protein